MSAWRLAVGLLAAAAYLGLSHWLTLHAAGHAWALAACLAPIWLAATLVALRRRQRRLLAALLVSALGVAAIVASGGIGDIRRLYLLQHAGIHLLLAGVFANTLRAGRVSMIGGVATRIHGSSSADVLAYCRRVTICWVAYFLLMSAASVLVFALFSWTAWSTLANIVTPLAIAGLFVGEYLLRYWLHPEFERATLLDAARAYSQAAPR